MTTRARRWVAVAFVASLAANLFLGGMLAVGWLRHHGGWDGGKGGPPVRMWDRGLAVLDDAARAQAEAVRARHEPAVRAQRDSLRQARRAVGAALRDESADAAALQAALDNLRDQSAAMQTVIHGAMLDLAKTLAPADRGAFFKANKRHRPFRRHPPP